MFTSDRTRRLAAIGFGAASFGHVRVSHAGCNRQCSGSLDWRPICSKTVPAASFASTRTKASLLRLAHIPMPIEHLLRPKGVLKSGGCRLSLSEVSAGLARELGAKLLAATRR
jgi:hypothetical protein